MELVFAIAYSIVVPGLCMIIGILLGKRYGYNLRSDELLKEQLLKAKEDVEELNDTWENLKTSLFVIQGIKKKKLDPPPLEEQLKKAIEDENYELASAIQTKINELNKDDE